jgi:hypothetical protein
VSSSPFYRGSGWSGGGRTGKGIRRLVVATSMPAIRFGGEGKRRGEWGMKRRKMQCHFQERRGHQGCSGARGRSRRRHLVGLLEEEDGRPADRAVPLVNDEEAAGQARLEGGERDGARLG